MNLKNIKAVIFDFDGTLANDISYHINSYVQAFREIGIELTEKEKSNLIGKPMNITIKEIINRHKKGNMKEIKYKKTKLYENKIKGKFVLYKDVEISIKKLKKKYKLAILTASNKKLLYDSMPSGFRKNFSVIETGEENFKPKPDPEGLFIIAKKLKLNPSDCIYVGDMDRDMYAAKNAGMIAFGIKRGMKEDLEKADFRIKSLKELIKMLS